MIATFDVDDFVASCTRAANESHAIAKTRRVVKQAVGALVAGSQHLPALGEGDACVSGAHVLGRDRTVYEDDKVTVVIVETEPGYQQAPHDHGMPAIIGVVAGIEVNRFYRRQDARVELATRRRVRPGEVVTLAAGTVHAISAEGGTCARALHVYLGGLSSKQRSLFHPESGVRADFSLDGYLQWARPIESALQP